MHVGRIKLIVVAAALLRAIKCGARILQQDVALFAVMREEADADTGRREELLPVEVKRSLHRLAYRGDYFRYRVGSLDAGQHQGKLIASKARDRIALGYTAP